MSTSQPDSSKQTDTSARQQTDDAALLGMLPGGELPTAIYRAIVLVYVWMAIAAWVAFSGSADVDLSLLIVSVLGVVFLGIPIILVLVAAARQPRSRTPLKGFLSSNFETATGEVSGAQASLQVLLIPVALAVAATLIGTIRLLS